MTIETDGHRKRVIEDASILPTEDGLRFRCVIDGKTYRNGLRFIDGDTAEKSAKIEKSWREMIQRWTILMESGGDVKDPQAWVIAEGDRCEDEGEGMSDTRYKKTDIKVCESPETDVMLSLRWNHIDVEEGKASEGVNFRSALVLLKDEGTEEWGKKIVAFGQGLIDWAQEHPDA